MENPKELTDAKLRSLPTKRLCRLLNSAKKEVIFGQGLIDRAEYPDMEPNAILGEIAGKSKATIQRLLNIKKLGYKEDRLDFLLLLKEEFDFACYDDLKCRIIREETDDPLKVLAGKLALNLVDVSTPTGEHEQLPYQNILKHDWLRKMREGHDPIARERFVAIIGADASTAATPKENPIPDLEACVRKVRETFGRNVSEKFINHQVNMLRKQSSSSIISDFEIEMRALVGFNKEAAVKQLKALCGYRNTPSLTYEIIAHMFKHRFVDVIVNFNNDELLDNAIEEELPNQTDYRYIYTAGHCPGRIEDLYIDNRMRRPIYVKCHGTISHQNSLRLDGDSAFVMETAIQEHLEGLFMGEVPDSSTSNQEELPLNLLIFGFSMENTAFNRILDKVLKEKREKVVIWLFDVKSSSRNNVVATIRSRFEKYFSKPNQSLELFEIPLRSHYALESNLIELWHEIENCFKEPYSPQGIARHELLNHVFKGYSPISLMEKVRREEYHRDRLYVEIALLLLQTDGFIHLSQLSNNRVGKFYELVKKKENREISHYLRNMGLSKYNGFVYDTYHIDNENKKASGEELIDYIKKFLRKNLTNKKPLTGRRGKDFEGLAVAVRQKRLGMVNPKYSHIHDNLFSEVKVDDVMNTSLSWVYSYRRMLEERIDDWDVMLSITEKGRFLSYDVENTDLSKKKFALILARYSKKAKLTEYTEKLASDLNHLSGQIKYRSWWLHNKHMVIFLKKKTDFPTKNWRKDWELVVGFYYSSRMLSRRISPIRVGSYDLKKLMNIFAIYWKGASEEGEKEDSHIVTSRDEVDDILNELLNKYHTSL